jgi:hypothetical protein
MPGPYVMANKHEPDQYNRDRKSRNIKLALAFAAVVVLWYIVAMIVIWTQ